MRSATCLNASEVIQIHGTFALGENMKSLFVAWFLLAFIALGQMQVLGQRSGGERGCYETVRHHSDNRSICPGHKKGIMLC
jgi:hypothetical protein